MRPRPQRNCSEVAREQAAHDSNNEEIGDFLCDNEGLVALLMLLLAAQIASSDVLCFSHLMIGSVQIYTLVRARRGVEGASPH